MVATFSLSSGVVAVAKQSVFVQWFYDGAWHDISGSVLAPGADGGQEIVITWGTPMEGSPIAPCRITLTLDNRDGQMNPHDPTAAIYGKVVTAKPGRAGTPVMVVVGASTRCVAELVSVAPDHTEDGKAAWVRIEAAGSLQRLGADTSPPRSALERFVVRNDPVAYWTLASSSIDTVDLPTVGPHPFNINAGRAKFGSAELAPWLPPGVSILEGVRMGGNVTMTRTPGAGGWAVDWLANVTPDSMDFDVYIGGNGSGTEDDERIDWRIGLDSSTQDVSMSMIFATGNTSSEIGLGLPVSAPQLFDGRVHHFRFRAFQSGANISWQMFGDGRILASGSQNGFTLQGISRITAISPTGTGSTPAAFGHVIVWGDPVPLVSDTVDAAFGHTGEVPLQRIMRLAEEEGVPFAFDSVDDGPPMGPQPTATPIEVWTQCAATGRGILMDSARSSVGLQYRTLRSMYTQDAALTLDYAANQVDHPLLPVADDLAVVEGDTSAVNTMHPAITQEVASWGAHLGEFDGLRFPLIRIDLVGSPELVPAVNSLQPGQRVVVENVPPFISRDAVSVIVAQITETIGAFTRTVDLACIPEQTHRVLIYQDDGTTVDPDAPARWDSEFSQTHAPFISGSDTELAVGTTLGPRWTTDPGDLPFDIDVTGARLRVTDIDAQTATIRGMETATGFGSTLNVDVPAGVQDGDVLLLFHAADLGASGVMVVDGDWELFVDVPTADGGCRVWWRVADNEPSSYQVSQPSNADGVVALVAIAGGVHARPAARSSNDVLGSGTVVSCPDGYAPGGGIVFRWACGEPITASATWSPPSGYTEMADLNSNGFITAELSRLTVSDAEQLPAVTATSTESLADRAGVTIGVAGQQVFTVQQIPLNGVSKVVPVGSPVHVWRAAVFGL